jgi:hypothetical protein
MLSIAVLLLAIPFARKLGVQLSVAQGLKLDLDAVQERLKTTESKLGVTESKLSATQSELSSTANQLQTVRTREQRELDGLRDMQGATEDLSRCMDAVWNSELGPKLPSSVRALSASALAKAQQAKARLSQLGGD